MIEYMRSAENLKHIPIVVVTAKELTAKERDMLKDQVDMLLQKGSFLDDEFVENLIARLN